jgi:RNA polymerase sigma-70 factor, ECF subfamily
VTSARRGAHPAPDASPGDAAHPSRDDVADFDQLYQAHYGRVLAIAYALSADAEAAQDLTQEAFCRAWQRWHRIGAYDDPVAWIRRVITNLAASRWRRLAIARKYLHRHLPAQSAPLDPDHVAVIAALRELPVPQRQAVVLHHLVDLPVADVAHELGVPEGTVKSWLHRGRAALAARLADPATEVTSDG